MTIDEFRRNHPGLFVLDPERPQDLADYLRQRGLLDGGERVELSRAGEGNMNCTLRIRINGTRTLVVKQSRPWVEKYPQFEAPWDRSVSEWRFYEAVSGHPAIRRRMPEVLGFDADARCLVLEDLGEGGDCSDLYRGARLAESEAADLGAFLGCLHRSGAQVTGLPDNNLAMRRLNHAHIFVIPLTPDNGLDLDRISPGLGTVASRLKEDTCLRERVRRLGQELYLQDGPTLLHGDFFPGSVLRGTGGLAVIDPEFCFNGRAEYDVGVWLGHQLLARQPERAVQAWWEGYGTGKDLEMDLVVEMAGVEVIRRLIGYAQLPLDLGGEQRQELLMRAAGLVQAPTMAGYGEVLRWVGSA